MSQIVVGVRELKASLSRYLREVAAGHTVLITDRGRPVGQIIPVASAPADRLQHLAAAGLLAWSGQKLAYETPQVENHSSLTIADLLIEDRE